MPAKSYEKQSGKTPSNVLLLHNPPNILGFAAWKKPRGPHASCAPFSINISARCLKLEERSDALKLLPASRWDTSWWWRNWVAPINFH